MRIVAQVRLFGVIEKSEKQDDGSVIITGVASSEAVDRQGEIITADAMRKALPEWMRFGNIRENHSNNAVGKALSANVSDDGKTNITARIVDSEAVKKVTAGVYKGFSIAGDVIKRAEKTITELWLGEISITDRPINPECTFSIWKADTQKPMDLKSFAKALKLPETATEQEILDAIAKAQTPPTPAPAPAPVVPDFQKALTDALKPINDKLAGIESANEEHRKTIAKAERATLIAEASREGKVIPLTNEAIERMPVADLKDMVAKLQKAAVTLPGSRPTKPLDETEKANIVKGSFARGVAYYDNIFNKALGITTIN